MTGSLTQPTDVRSPRFHAELAAAVADFGSAVREKLADRDAEKEDQLRAPLETLMRRIGRAFGLRVVPHGEVRLVQLHARPDYSIDVAGARVGYIELKAPGKGVPLTPSWQPTTDDIRQWENLKALPNLMYSDGNHWALYRYGNPYGEPVLLDGDITKAGRSLKVPGMAFGHMMDSFLYWEPEKPRSLQHLVSIIAGLCRLLNEEVAAILRLERRGASDIKLFERLAEDWRRLLYPDMTDDEFANAYAQTITFALLLARVDGISFQGLSTAMIAKLLRKRHPLMGRALEVLTDKTAERGGIIETLSRVIGAVDWDRYARDNKDPYALLYEKFLEIYDPRRRQDSGTYYTPPEVVQFMVRFVDQVIRTRLDYPLGIADENVIVLDPAMGTGTYLAEAISLAAGTITEAEGAGAVSARLRTMCERLLGFELQAGPYAVAELRIYSELRKHHADPPDHMRLCVTDTLDSPYKEEEIGMGHLYEEIARSREDATYIKREAPVLVIMGNPPYGGHAMKHGKWVLESSGALGKSLLDDFRMPGSANLGYSLHDKYVYFWRWALWKAFEAHPEHPAGIVAFITPSSFVKGPGFAQFREYLRRTADEGWIIDLSPEDYRPDVPHRIFAQNKNPVCISVFVRCGRLDPDPAVIHHVAAAGLREDKFHVLGTLGPDSADFADGSRSWPDPLQPRPPEVWSAHPALSDLLLLNSPGITPGRTWVYGLRPQVLRDRIERLTHAPDEEQPALFGPRPPKVPEDQYRARVASVVRSLRSAPTPPEICMVAHGAFDRKYVIADDRLVDRLRPDLWQARHDNQVFATELHTAPIREGPALLFSSLVPDKHHFMGTHGGRVFPLYRDAALPNISPALLPLLARHVNAPVTAQDLLAYIAAIAGGPAYTARFRQLLADFRGVRIPLTRDRSLWSEAVALGHTIIWLHTYGERHTAPRAGRPYGPPRLPAHIRPGVGLPGIPHSPTEMPDTIAYNPASQALLVGSGVIHPIPQEAWEYRVAGKRVIERWFRSRKMSPEGRRSSDLNDIRDNWWRPEATTELLDLLNVLSLLSKLEGRQADLLEKVMSAPVITRSNLAHEGIIRQYP